MGVNIVRILSTKVVPAFGGVRGGAGGEPVTTLPTTRFPEWVLFDGVRTGRAGGECDVVLGPDLVRARPLLSLVSLGFVLFTRTTCLRTTGSGVNKFKVRRQHK